MYELPAQNKNKHYGLVHKLEIGKNNMHFLEREGDDIKSCVHAT